MLDLNTPFTFLRYSSFTGSFDEILLDGYAGTQFNLSYGAFGLGVGCHRRWSAFVLCAEHE